MTTKQRHSLWGIAALIAFVALVCVGSMLVKGTFDLSQIVGAAGNDESPSPSPSPEIDAGDVANQLCGNDAPFEEFGCDKLIIGSNNVDFDANPAERGNAAFSKKTLKTQADVAAFLNGTSDKSKAVKERVARAITREGYGQHEVDRALDGSGFFPVQVTEAADFLGTTYFKDGKVLVADEWRRVKAGDILWLFMTEDGKIIIEATVRADCANPGLDKVRAITSRTPWVPSVECATNCKPPTSEKPRPNKPKPPTSEKPKPPPEKVCLPPTPHGTWPLCKDDPVRDVQNNPGVPDGSTGPGTTPVGTDPGPAEAPVDSPTGCNGPCPEPDKPSSPNPPSKPQPTLPKPTQPPVTPDPVRESPEPEEPIPTPEPEW